MEQNLNGKPGEVHMTVEITRAATGKKECIDLIGHIVPDTPDDNTLTPDPKENEHGRNPLNSGT